MNNFLQTMAAVIQHPMYVPSGSDQNKVIKVIYHGEIYNFYYSLYHLYQGQNLYTGSKVIKVRTVLTGAYRFVDLGKSEIRPYRSLDLGNRSLQIEVKSL